jgi:adenine deaminase
VGLAGVAAPALVDPRLELAVERELAARMQAAGHPFHDPLYSLLFASGDFLPEVRLTPRGVLEVKTRTVLEGPSRIDTVSPR